MFSSSGEERGPGLSTLTCSCIDTLHQILGQADIQTNSTRTHAG